MTTQQKDAGDSIATHPEAARLPDEAESVRHGCGLLVSGSSHVSAPCRG